MAFQLASAFVELATKGFGLVTGQIGAVGSALQAGVINPAARAANAFSGMADSALQAINPLNHLTELLVGLGATLGTAGLFRMGAGVETELVQFGVLMKGNKQAAAEFIEKVRAFSDVTPFTESQLLPLAKQLTGYGLAIDDIIPKLQRLGDIAALVDNPAESLASFSKAYGQAFMTKRVGGDVLAIFREKGVPIMQELARVMKIPGDNVLMLERYIQEGRVPLAALEQALYNLTKAGGQYFEGTKQLSETTGGLWSTLVSKVQNTMKRVGVSMLEAFNVKGLLASAISFMDGLWERHGETVVAILQSIGRFGKNVWNGISEGFSRAWTILAGIAPDLNRIGMKGDSVFEEWGTAIGQMIGALAEGVANLIEHLSDTGFLDDFMEAMGILAGAVMALAQHIKDITPDATGYGAASERMFKNLDKEGLTEEEKNLIPGYKKRKREQAQSQKEREAGTKGVGDYSGDTSKRGGGDFDPDKAPGAFNPFPLGKISFTSISGLWERLQEQASSMAIMNQQLSAMQGTAEASKASSGSLASIDRNIERIANRPGATEMAWS